MSKNLGIAYSVKKKAKGGKVGPKTHETGVHEPYAGTVGGSDNKGLSKMGDETRWHKATNSKTMPKSKAQHQEHARGEAKRIIEEQRSMPKPNLPMAEGGQIKPKFKSKKDTQIDELTKHHPKHTRENLGMLAGEHVDEIHTAAGLKSKPKLAEGGMIDKKSATTAQRGMKTTPIKHPTMQQSPVFKINLRDEEDHMMASDAPASPEEEIREPMAEGGAVHKRASDSGYEHALEGRIRQSEKAARETGASTRTGDLSNTSSKNIEHHKSTMATMHKPKYAEGGEIDGGAEESMDHEDSIAAAIMARRDQLHEEIDSGAHDLDTAVKMAEGGQVDIDENGMEEPNDFYSLNEDDALKENYDSDMDDVSQPDDSNEHGHEIDKDTHDMSDKIRKQMKARRKA